MRYPALLSVAGALFVAGCAAPPQPEPPLTATIEATPAGDISSSEEVLMRLITDAQVPQATWTVIPAQEAQLDTTNPLEVVFVPLTTGSFRIGVTVVDMLSGKSVSTELALEVADAILEDPSE